MLDWQQTIKAKYLGVDTYIEEVAPCSSKYLDNKAPTKSIFDTCDNSFKAKDCLFVLKKTRIKNINNVVIRKLNVNSLSKNLTMQKRLQQQYWIFW